MEKPPGLGGSIFLKLWLERGDHPSLVGRCFKGFGQNKSHPIWVAPFQRNLLRALGGLLKSPQLKHKAKS
jgi:hypothetical protein